MYTTVALAGMAVGDAGIDADADGAIDADMEARDVAACMLGDGVRDANSETVVLLARRK